MKQFGPIYLDRDSFFIGTPGNWVGIHVDGPWTECVKNYDAPQRIYVHLWLAYLSIGLPSKGEDGHWHFSHGQRWSWRTGITEHYQIITFNMNRKLQCKEKIDERFICGAFRWHPGPHRSTVNKYVRIPISYRQK